VQESRVLVWELSVGTDFRYWRCFRHQF